LGSCFIVQDKSPPHSQQRQQRQALRAKALGQAAENAALDYLQGQGLCLVARNVRFRVGELDLIMKDQTTIVFVEVRWRRSAAFGSAAASVDWRKQQRMIRAAQLWLGRFGQDLPACRFDVVACSPGRLDWLAGAFGQPELL
jgi:putative endonuclease